MFSEESLPVLAIYISTLFGLAQANPALHHTRDSLDSGHCEHKAYPKQCGENWDYTAYPTDQQERADAIVEMFRFAWDGYYTYAYPHDDLLPGNNSFSDSRNGWGLTMVDSLDSAIIMEQKDIIQIILDFIPTVDFTKNNSPHPVWTSLFETDIRYLGGLLSAYDLLKGPFSHLDFEDTRVDALLSQAVVLADTIKFAFDTPTGIPKNQIFIDNQTFTDDGLMQNGEYTAGLAELGTLVLEWQRLSDLTGMQALHTQIVTVPHRRCCPAQHTLNNAQQAIQNMAHWHRRLSLTFSMRMKYGQALLVITSAFRLAKFKTRMAGGSQAATRRTST